MDKVEEMRAPLEKCWPTYYLVSCGGSKRDNSPIWNRSCKGARQQSYAEPVCQAFQRLHSTVLTPVLEALAVSACNRSLWLEGNGNDQVPQWVLRACLDPLCLDHLTGRGFNREERATDPSHNQCVNGRLAGTVWSRQDEAGSHVCWEAWLQLPAERGALPTPQSATGSQLGGRHSLASCFGCPPSLLWILRARGIFPPSSGGHWKLPNSKALGDRPWDCVASYRNLEQACLLYLTGLWQGLHCGPLQMPCAQYMVNACLLKWMSSQRLFPVYCGNHTLSSWGGTLYPAPHKLEGFLYF